MTTRKLSFFDKVLIEFDHGLRTIAARAPQPQRPSPAEECQSNEMSDQEMRHAAGLMRVNHSGEVCAQALYRGQALTAKLPEVRREMELAADEEIDHLAWCEQRIHQLGSHTSVLNPLWYSLSFGIGAGAGLISDRLSLGFVAATEDQVCKHLESHLQQLPEQDEKSRAVVELMLEDEARHSHTALSAGGLAFPRAVKSLMTAISAAMTTTSYRI
ncbi:2-polyprenyl-3-methyl-6-methoxy-1,4-benzoquinone monooxygenase [Porticoccaceae bacterium LTM1]|nr:2-polyprenyl-3-methyl-6-methoxy-1,4-benzoquinone monooxygenase [Porticoccaceae bacterium LTM1]